MRVIDAEYVRRIMKAALEASAKTNDADIVITIMLTAFKDMVSHERPI